MGLLGDVYSAGNTLKRRMKGLLSDPVGYVQQIGGFLADNAKESAAKDKAAFASGADAMAQRGLDYLNGQAMGFAPLGMTAWHGSPHKFDKFSLDKIGTGEGAQAYGHGLYLAESPKVAQEYQKRLSDAGDVMTYNWKGGTYEGGTKGDPVAHALGLTYHQGKAQAVKIAKQGLADAKAGEPYALDLGGADYYQRMLNTAQQLSKKDIKATTGQLYKTDIPDEAVARFLDWDKPLSQQAPEVQAALKKSGLLKEDGSLSFMYNETPRAGSDMYERITSPLAKKVRGEDDASTFLRKQGIPGIRYLDGGSRSAGQGSSNFVVFDPEMIRILERNGQSTGLMPWKQGEYRGLLNP